MKIVRYNDKIWFGKYKGNRFSDIIMTDPIFIIKHINDKLIELDDKTNKLLIEITGGEKKRRSNRPGRLFETPHADVDPPILPAIRYVNVGEVEEQGVYGYGEIGHPIPENRVIQIHFKSNTYQNHEHKKDVFMNLGRIAIAKLIPALITEIRSIAVKNIFNKIEHIIDRPQDCIIKIKIETRVPFHLKDIKCEVCSHEYELLFKCDAHV